MDNTKVIGKLDLPMRNDSVTPKPNKKRGIIWLKDMVHEDGFRVVNLERCYLK